MLKKISHIASWNISSAILNFGMNFILARQLGNAFFGEFSLYNSKVALLGLIFIIIPTNYAVVKFQDDEKFKSIYFSFYFLASFVFLLVLMIASYIGYLNLPIYSMFLYSWPLFFISFFDTLLQSDNQLNKYFKILFVISFVKLFFFLIAYFVGAIHDLNSVIFTVGSANLLCILCLIYYYCKSFINSINILQTLVYIKKNFNHFRGYYFASIIKSLSDNFFILIFNGILTKSQLGLFSLFIKAQSFSFSFFRIFEAFLMNKKNNIDYFDIINKKKHLLGFLLFLCTFFFASTYIYTLNAKIYLLESFFIGLCAFPYVSLLIIRSKQLLSYDNRALNLTIIFEMLILFVFQILIKFNNINADVLVCVFFVLFSHMFRVLFLKSIINKL